MKSVLLHGGDLVAYEAINSNGHPVWESASAFLDSLARTPSLGERYSRFLAVPRVCSGGSRIEWYIPDFPPQDPSGDYRIIAWDAATPEERQQAYEKLMDLDKALYAYGNMLLSRGVDGDNLTFAQFLTGRGAVERLPAIHHPGPECVFIVDGQPVITFWGFLRKGERVGAYPFGKLRQATGASGAGVHAAAAGTASRHHCLIPAWLWWLLLPLLLLLIAYLVWWWLSARTQPPFTTWPWEARQEVGTAPVATPDRDDPRAGPAQVRGTAARDVDHGVVAVERPVVQGGTAVVDPALAVPGTVDQVAAAGTEGTSGRQDLAGTVGDNATPAAGQEAATPATGVDGKDTDPSNTEAGQQGAVPGTPEGSGRERGEAAGPGDQPAGAQPDPASAALPPIDPDRQLSLDQGQLDQGSTAALNGKWLTRSGIMDAETGQPVNLSYDFKDGKGNITITRKDGTACKVPGRSAVQGGALVISANGNAVCPDGKSYTMPTITCQPGKDGRAVCKGSYGGGEDFNLTMYGDKP